MPNSGIAGMRFPFLTQPETNIYTLIEHKPHDWKHWPDDLSGWLRRCALVITRKFIAFSLGTRLKNSKEDNPCRLLLSASS